MHSSSVRQREYPGLAAMAVGFLFMRIAGSLDPQMRRLPPHLVLIERVQSLWLPIAPGTAKRRGVTRQMRLRLKARGYAL
mgnify:CR=1 FL=1